MNADSIDLTARVNELHTKILSGDGIADSEMAELVLPILTARLTKIFPAIYDDHLIDTAVTDAVLNYFENPAKYMGAKISNLINQ